jgi:CheY-like chemotaxis protein
MKILVLDDSIERLQAFKRGLIGHVVVLTSTAPEAIEALDEQGPFDYVFLDHDLGDMSMVPSGPGTGYEVALWLCKNSAKQPPNIIIHSLNPAGAKAMASLLPTAKVIPGVWTKLML